MDGNARIVTTEIIGPFSTIVETWTLLRFVGYVQLFFWIFFDFWKFWSFDSGICDFGFWFWIWIWIWICVWIWILDS